MSVRETTVDAIFAVIMAEDPEGHAWGQGLTRDEALDAACTAMCETVQAGDEEAGEFVAHVYIGAVWVEVSGKGWDEEIESYQSREDVQVYIDHEGWRVCA